LFADALALFILAAVGLAILVSRHATAGILFAWARAAGRGWHVGASHLAGVLVGGGIAAFVANAAFHALQQVGLGGAGAGDGIGRRLEKDENKRQDRDNQGGADHGQLLLSGN